MTFLASEWALRHGGDEGVENAALRRRGDDWDGWRRLSDWGIGMAWEWGALDELPWRFCERVFIQPGSPGILKIV